MIESTIYCRFPHKTPVPASYILDTPNGCVCYPDDRVQAICEQHYIKDGMGDGWTVIKELPLPESDRPGK